MYFALPAALFLASLPFSLAQGEVVGGYCNHGWGAPYSGYCSLLKAPEGYDCTYCCSPYYESRDKGYIAGSYDNAHRFVDGSSSCYVNGHLGHVSCAQC
ncbi:hypothetical protein TI39_contig4456g00002 [Zymoseptoria brevis]|uniref:Uncharacterized protein n=1 Tax=Zymoseptoria brevis TaxID=1047168 RepID=A0A0F4G6M1_9PEZI|nr:hypothetical protein TI39_contig4456g00002 [Zymoseptoria brevis]